MKDFASHDATSLAALVRAGEVSPRELVTSAIERIESLNPKLNAVVHKMYASALKLSDEVERILGNRRESERVGDEGQRDSAPPPSIPLWRTALIGHSWRSAAEIARAAAGQGAIRDRFGK